MSGPATAPHINAQPNAERQLWAAYRLILSWPKREQAAADEQPRRDDDQHVQHSETQPNEAAA
jgi:hypothetical protein